MKALSPGVGGAPTFTAATCAISKTWKEPECPSADERIKTMRCGDKLERYSATHQEEGLPGVPTRTGLEDMVLTEISPRTPGWSHVYVEPNKPNGRARRAGRLAFAGGGDEQR